MLELYLHAVNASNKPKYKLESGIDKWLSGLWR